MGEANTSGADGAGGAPSNNRVFHMLENNPEVMNALAYRLGLSKKLAFHDVYSLYDPDLLSFIPRPIHALIATIPLTPAWKENREAEDSQTPWYTGAGFEEPVIWFKQTISHGCGLIGLLHAIINGEPSNMIEPGSLLAKFVEQAAPLKMKERADLLKASDQLYEASEAVAVQGDSPLLELDVPTGNHFLALVKGRDGHLWELEGSRKGPLDRGSLDNDEDGLSDRALELGMKRLIEISKDSSGGLRFSCIALGPSYDNDA